MAVKTNALVIGIIERLCRLVEALFISCPDRGMIYPSYQLTSYQLPVTRNPAYSRSEWGS